MPRYGGSYHGDFYTGPSPLEALVGEFLDTRTALSDRKRQQQLEEEQRAQAAADRQRSQAIQDIDIAERGYTRNPDELVAAGARGYSKTGLSAAEQAENRASARTASADLKTQTAQQELQEAIAIALDRTRPEAERSAAVARVTSKNPSAGLQLASMTKAADPIKKPWERDGFATEAEWLGSKGREAASTRAPRDTAGDWHLVTSGAEPVWVNNRTREVRPAEGITPKQGNRPVTAAENQGAALFQMGTAAVKLLNGDPTTGQKPLDAPGQASRWLFGRQDPAQPGGIENFALSANDQKFYDASTALAMAYQYAVSGKAVTREEGRKIAAQIIPAFGDGPDLIRQKVARRQDWIRVMQQMGGRAVPPDAVQDPFDEEYDAMIGGR